MDPCKTLLFVPIPTHLQIFYTILIPIFLILTSSSHTSVLMSYFHLVMDLFLILSQPPLLVIFGEGCRYHEGEITILDIHLVFAQS